MSRQIFNQGQVDAAANTSPSVTFLMLLVVCEYAAVVALRYFFRSAHGG